MKMSLILASMVLLAGCAGQAPRTDEPAKAARYADTYCLHQTGTSLRVPAGSCANATGRSYSREQIEQANAPNLKETLGRLTQY